MTRVPYHDYTVIVMDDEQRLYKMAVSADWGTDVDVRAKEVGQRAAEGVMLLDRRRLNGDDHIPTELRVAERFVAHVIDDIERVLFEEQARREERDRD